MKVCVVANLPITAAKLGRKLLSVASDFWAWCGSAARRYAKMPSALADPLEEGFVTAPLSAGPPPLFDVTSFSKWVTDVFTEEHDDEVLDKLAAMDASDDMAKMRLLLNEEVAARRARLGGDAIHKSYTPPEEGAGSRDVMMIAFAGENDTLVRAKPRARSTPRITPAT